MADDLWAQRSNILCTQNFTINSDQGPFVGQLTVVGLAVSAVTPETGSVSDFFAIEQRFSLNPNKMYKHNVDDDTLGYVIAGYFAIDYTIETTSHNFPNNPNDFPLLSNSPDTTVGSTTYTTSLSHTFSGSIGVFGDQLTATASDSYTVTNSTSVNIPDITVENLSMDQGNNAKWAFLFNNNDDRPPTLSSTSMFQPVVTTMWEMKNPIPSVEELEFVTRIAMNFKLVHIPKAFPFIHDTVKTYNICEEIPWHIKIPVNPPQK
ncbi:hypothetical protein DFP93_105227 [Aneurinibacillus soli]|uniref:Uncharacterized protein n=1 Tax=Aneurinibacillus soli TaxID=1500254 RepID=A0A0U5BCS5_9BACL|nr:hypothetical protein [Aneurinibacillus soli]PYE62270.1 hypothetical protein DFP93_105227 [Aneurinibacillus soli]BAU28541.1 hypothetical protein CB4_02716 [Aneurinibacillus soli]